MTTFPQPTALDIAMQPAPPEHPDRFERRFLLIAAVALILLVMAFQALLIFVTITDAGKAFASNAQQWMFSLAMLLVGYYWGSSKGSQDKTQSITSIATKDPKP